MDTSPTLPEHDAPPDGTEPRGRGWQRQMSRAGFLGLFAGGGAFAWGGPRLFNLLTGGWRINTVENPRPEFDPQAYRLVIDGLVTRPSVLTYDELRALPAVRQISDFHCVEGWGVPDVQWDGVRLQTLIAMAGPQADAEYITFHSLGGIYRDSLTIRQAELPDVLIAYDMDGAQLPAKHGAPLRLVMPRMYGYKGSKWLTRIEFRDAQDIGYWEERGWRVDAWING